MDAAYEIVAEAATVIEARHRAERQVPSGMEVLSIKERWPESGQAHASGDEPLTARDLALAQVPPGADIVSETVLDVGEEVSVYALDLEDAARRLGATYGEAVDGAGAHLLCDGDAEVHSVGYVRYGVALRKPYAVVTYRCAARVALRLGPTRPRRRHLL